MKIHIIGSSGSGKSLLAGKLSNELHIPHYDLDDVNWNNSSDTYGLENTFEEKTKLINKILSEKNWIIEGVYYDKWCIRCFKEADKIFILNTDKSICKRRVFFRFIKRFFNIEKGRKSSLKSFINLIKRIEEFNKNEFPKIKELLKQYKEKIIEV